MGLLLFLLLTAWQSGYSIYWKGQAENAGKIFQYVRTDQTYPSGLEPGAVVINEILFNPRLQGADFVEIYNRGNEAIDLKGWHLANRNAAGNIASQKLISASSLLIAPGEYRVITENPDVLQEQYQVKDPAVFIQLASLPSYPNAGGTVVLLDAGNEIADEVAYSENWHFSLLNDLKGISLERIDPGGASGDPDNWHSAASSAGYATPGSKNSQLYVQETTGEAIIIDPLVFSPDNDGYNDYTMIGYRFPEPGYVCTITLFTRAGAPVRYLTRNALCGTTGFFKWDGLDEKNQPLGIGTYIVVAEVFNLNGKTFRYKKSVTLARRL